MTQPSLSTYLNTHPQAKWSAVAVGAVAVGLLAINAFNSGGQI